jgi:O-antigen/teichoic acid export membrane protein
MAVALVLARLLTPHEWGLAAMVLVFSGFVVVFTDNALGTALIQRKVLFPGDRSTVFWLSALIGLLLALAGVACSGLIAQFYGEPDVRPLFVVASLGFLVTSLGSTQAALLIRDMKFRLLELRLLAATLLGAAVAIVVAVKGFGAWAIVAQQVTEACVSTVLLWVLSPWRPSLTCSRASIRRLGRFAGNVFAENFLFQAGRNAGNLLIGRFLGAAALGVYSLATTVILVPFWRIAAPLQQVFLPAFSELQNDRERLARLWIRTTRLIAAVAMPALVALVILAPDFVQVVLGSRWEAATPVIQILAWVGLLQALQALNAEILLALDRSGTLLRFTVVWLVATTGATAIGLHWGILGVAACYAVATAFVELLRAYLTVDALGIPLRRVLVSLRGVAEASVFMAIVLFGLRAGLVAQGVPPALRLVVLVGVGALVYLCSCAWRAPEVRAEVEGLLARYRKSSRKRDSLEPGLLERSSTPV